MSVERGLTGLALGRVGLGLLSRFAPRKAAALFGAGYAASPELDYVTRVFGARAFALGTGYLLSEGDARALWQRLAFACDVSDTVTALGDLHRGEVPRRVALAAAALTGSYMAVGGLKVARDLGGG